VFQPTLLLFAAGEERVITMALMGKIRGMYFRDRKSISEIARLTSLSRNTIKRWLRTAPGTQPKYRRGEVTTKLTPFVAVLTKALEIDAYRPRRERRTARALHAQLKAQGYAGGTGWYSPPRHL
jgi:transposase-like protein